MNYYLGHISLWRQHFGDVPLMKTTFYYDPSGTADRPTL